jgi:imidazole glycerol-phosphate synthase subunit HisH
VIAIVDYGAGNVTSVKKALQHLGVAAEVTSDAQVIRAAEKLVVPGVGHFNRCQTLNRQLRLPLLEAFAENKPFLGICVGMQWLYEGSAEAPETSGAGMFAGECSRFPPGIKCPHVGWNQIDVRKDSRLLRGIESGAFVYYTHSYRAPVTEETIATTEYGDEFAAAVERDRVFAVQFHPEKSGATGLKILENFCGL